MENLMAKKEIVALCLESPLYFTMPLAKRLEFIKSLLEPKSSGKTRREDFLHWIRTGELNGLDK